MDKNRLKVLWLSHLVPYPPKSGVLMRSYHLLRELARYHEIDLFAFNQSRQLRSHFGTQHEGLSVARAHFGEFVRRFHVEPIPSESGRWGQQWLALSSLVRTDPYTINWLKSRTARHSLAAWLSDTSYDLVHFDTISLAPYFSSLIRCPTALDHHNIESHMMLRRASLEKSRLKRIYFQQEGIRLLRYERRHLKRFSGHIVCSEDDRLRLLEVDPNIDVKVVPNGVVMPSDPPQRRPAMQPPRLLFIGGLDWYPNADAVHFLLDSIWPLIKARIPDVQIDIIGKNPSARMREHASLDPSVRVHGFVDDISKYYAEATVYVCPIRDGGGTKLKVIDALAHRVPLVAWPAACEGLSLRDDADALIADTAEAFAQSTVRIVQSPQLGERLGNAGYESVRNRFDFSRIGQTLAHYYADVTKKSAR